MEEDNYILYMHRNKINGKVYIGQTKKKPEYRWNHGEGYKTCSYFYSAIQKYGWDNFEHIILKEHLTLEEANKNEILFIQLYDSTNPDKGYNILLGGSNAPRTEKQKEQQSIFMKDRWKNNDYRQYYSNMMIAKWKDKNYRKKIISSISGEKSHFFGSDKKGINNPMYGKHHSEESKKKISEKAKQRYKDNPNLSRGGNNPMAKAVRCLPTGEEFETAKAAAEWMQVSPSTMNRWLHQQTKTTGFHPVTKEPLKWIYIE